MPGRNVNEALTSAIVAAGLSHAQVARMFVRIALENGAEEFVGVGRSHVSHWVRGTRPSGNGPIILREAMTRLCGRPVSLEALGLGGVPDFTSSADWESDTLVALTDLGRADVDVDRRHLLRSATYSLAALVLPSERVWSNLMERGEGAGPERGARVGGGDVDAVRDMIAAFSRADQRRGGGHARKAVSQYLTSDVVAYLNGRFPNAQTRREMFSAASELAYLCGWMSFDNSEHAIAQRYFRVALKLAAEGDDPPMAGHVLRAMAHQAVDLNYPAEALSLAIASTENERYSLATSRERSLLGVVQARAFAAAGQSVSAASALLRAEDDLRTADSGDNDPDRVFFFGEASLAHETACTLRDLGDYRRSISQFRRSVRMRQSSAFTRTHAVTLGYLGDVHARRGEVDEACVMWGRALDAMNGVRSGRTRSVAADMRASIAQFRTCEVLAVRDVDSRAAQYLAETARAE